MAWVDDRPGTTGVLAAQHFLAELHGATDGVPNRQPCWVNVTEGLFRAGEEGVRIYHVYYDRTAKPNPGFRVVCHADE